MFSKTNQHLLLHVILKIVLTALELKPDDALVLKRRADVRGKLGMKAQAIDDYKQAVEIQGRLEWQKQNSQSEES